MSILLVFIRLGLADSAICQHYYVYMYGDIIVIYNSYNFTFEYLSMDQGTESGAKCLVVVRYKRNKSYEGPSTWCGIHICRKG